MGLVNEEKVLAEATISDLQAEKLMFYVKEAGIKPEQIEGIAVTVGPGSYAGLRAGLATAKSLAQVLNIPLVGISTLEAIAYNLIDIEGAIMVILDARADEYNFALFGADQGRLKRLTDDLVIKNKRIFELLTEIKGKIWLVGKTDEFRSLASENLRFVEEVRSYPYGLNVAHLGLLKFKEGKIDDLFNLVPHYSHKPTFREYYS